jgi:hypothetical protein
MLAQGKGPYAESRRTVLFSSAAGIVGGLSVVFVERKGKTALTFALLFRLRH